MNVPIYHVTVEVPCRFCGGKSKKCYTCKGTGVEGVPVVDPVSVLVWQDVKRPPIDDEYFLLAFRENGVTGVQIAKYVKWRQSWENPFGAKIEHPIAYATLMLPDELREVTK